MVQFIMLFGGSIERERAKTLLENLPHIKRVDIFPDSRMIRLISEEPEKEKDLIPLLAQSGISGFRLM